MLDVEQVKNQLEAMTRWNAMVSGLQKARKEWETFAEARVYPGDFVPNLVLKAMERYARGSTFEKSVPDMVRFWATNGGLDTLEIPKSMFLTIGKLLKEKENGTKKEQ